MIAQVAPAATVVPQLFVCEKGALSEILEMVSVVPVKFVSVTVWAALIVPTGWEKYKLAGERVTVNADPESVAVCGLPAASSVTVSEPVREPPLPGPPPTATGVKVTLIVQVAPAAKELPQLLVSPKSALAETPDMLTGTLPLFRSVTACAGLFVPTSWVPKIR